MNGTPNLGGGSGWQNVRLVAGREISTRLSSKSYRILTLVMMCIIAAVVVVFYFIHQSGPSTETVGITDESLATPVSATAQAFGANATTKVVADEATGKAQVKSGALDAFVTVDATGLQVIVNTKIDSSMSEAFNALAGAIVRDAQIQNLGGNPATINAEVARATAQISYLTPPKQYNTQGITLGIIAGALIYMTLMTLGQMVAQGVVEEKSSRVVELLLSTVQPWELMAGKVLGIGIVGLIQMLLYGLVGVVLGISLGVLTISITAAVGTVVWVVVWYLLGFLMYALAFAAAGALVSRQEEAGGVVMPILMFVIAAWVVGISILPSDPGNTTAAIMSVIPMFAPTLMPMRLAMGGVPIWQVTLAVVLTVAMIPALLALGSRIYRNAVLRTGARVKLSEALRAA